MLTTRARGTNWDKERLEAATYDKDEIPHVWDELRSHLVRSVKASDGMMSMEWLYEWLCKGEASVLCTERNGEIESVLVVSIAHYPSYNAARIIACGGENLAEAMEHFDMLQSWALLNDCQEIEGWVRPAMARLAGRFGFRHKREIVSFNLRSKLQ